MEAAFAAMDGVGPEADQDAGKKKKGKKPKFAKYVDAVSPDAIFNAVRTPW